MRIVFLRKDTATTIYYHKLLLASSLYSACRPVSYVCTVSTEDMKEEMEERIQVPQEMDRNTKKPEEQQRMHTAAKRGMLSYSPYPSNNY